jgi:hypothetical protein
MSQGTTLVPAVDNSVSDGKKSLSISSNQYLFYVMYVIGV